MCRTKKKPHACYVCPDCLKWMRDEQHEFRLYHCQEEMNQITADEDVAEDQTLVEDAGASAASELNVVQYAEGGHYARVVGSNFFFEEREQNHTCAVVLREAQDGDGNSLFNDDESLRFEKSGSGSNRVYYHQRDVSTIKKQDVAGNCHGSHRRKVKMNSRWIFIYVLSSCDFCCVGLFVDSSSAVESAPLCLWFGRSFCFSL